MWYNSCPFLWSHLKLLSFSSSFQFFEPPPPSFHTSQGLCTNHFSAQNIDFPTSFHSSSFSCFRSQLQCHRQGQPCLSTQQSKSTLLSSTSNPCLFPLWCNAVYKHVSYLSVYMTWLCLSSALENKLRESRNSGWFTVLFLALKREQLVCKWLLNYFFNHSGGTWRADGDGEQDWRQKKWLRDNRGGPNERREEPGLDQ